VIINRGINPTCVGPVVVGQAIRLPAAIPSATDVSATSECSGAIQANFYIIILIETAVNGFVFDDFFIRRD
jgi:hypothetical protein